MSIRSQYMLWFGLVILSLAALVLIDIIRLDSANEALKNIVNDKLQQMRLAREIDSNINNAAIAMAVVLYADKQDQINQEAGRINGANKTIREDMDKLVPLIRSEEGNAIFKGMIDAQARYQPGQEQFLKLASEGKRKDAAALFNGMLPLQQNYMDAAEKLTQFHDELLHKAGSDAIWHHQNTDSLFVILYGMVVTLAGITAFWISRNNAKLAGNTANLGGMHISENDRVVLIPDRRTPAQQATAHGAQQNSRRKVENPEAAR